MSGFRRAAPSRVRERGIASSVRVDGDLAFSHRGFRRRRIVLRLIRVGQLKFPMASSNSSLEEPRYPLIIADISLTFECARASAEPHAMP